MTRGLSRRQIGVTETMIGTFGETIFDLSHNLQIRRGDPVRLLDFAEIERQRAGLGLTDAQIAARIGLTREQVLYIRTLLEHRRFRTRRYQRLLELGGGRRFRAERFVPHGERATFSDEALELRAAMTFDPERARAYVEAGWWRNETLTSWLARHAEATPDRAAVRTAETTISYGELARSVARVAGGLHALGIGTGDVVAVQLPNVPEFLIAYLAVARLGAVMTTIHMAYGRAEIETLLDHSRARAVICLDRGKNDETARLMCGLRDRLPRLEHVIVVGSAVDGTRAFTDLMGGEEALEGVAPPVGADPFLLLYTSGTTAAPKGVPLAYHNMLSNARLGVPEHGLGPDDVILSAAPFTHLFGLYSFHLALAAGACSLLLPGFAPAALAEIVERGRPTAVFAAPAHLAAGLGGGAFEGRDLSSLRLAVVSGSACPPALARAFDALMPEGRFTQLWGMTETQAGLYTRPGDGIEVAAASAGRPSPGTEVRIVDAEGAPVAPGEEGELQVRGCLLFPGYYRNPEATRGAFTDDGWFRTGDLAVADKAGNVSITGRLKDIINRGGVKYNPREVEDLLSGHPDIRCAAIVPLADEVLGEKACCFVIPEGEARLTLEDICAYLARHRIAKYKYPERLEIVDDMPMTPTRKIIKERLAARLSR